MSVRNPKSVRGSYFASTISISLVLFLVGSILFLVLNAREISNYVKENIGFSIIIKDNVKRVDLKLFQKTLETKNYVNETKFIDKKLAAEQFKKQVGTDFVEFLGYNPLLASIDVKLNAKYANQDSISIIEKRLKKLDLVHDVYYQKSLVSAVNENVRKISVVLMGISVLMLLISFTLIRNTIHISIYSQRFIINTMQLVGAKSSFIRRPFLIKSVVNGLFAAMFANILLMGLIYLANEQVIDVMDFLDVKLLAILFAFVVLIGMFIAWYSTFFAVNKYLRKNINELYG